MDGSVLMTLAGTEAELRPLRAAQVLRARKEAAALWPELGEDGAAKRLTLAACVVAAGAYDGDKPLFESGRAALDVLDAQTLLDAAAEYGGAAQVHWLERTGTPEDGAPPARRESPQTEPAPEEAEPADGGTPDMPEKMETPETAHAAADKPEPDAVQDGRTGKKQPEQADEPARKPRQDGMAEQVEPLEKRRRAPEDEDRAAHERLDSRRMTWLEPETAVQAAPMEPGTAFHSGESGADMQRVSAYFERDSRRYDGGFAFY